MDSRDASRRLSLTSRNVSGFDGDFTWRYRFYPDLTRQHVSFDVVGSRRGPNVKPGYTTSQYADPHFDTDHFAQAGSPFSYHPDRIHQEITTQHPDIVVLELGVNDLRFGHSPEDTDTRLRRWISEAREADPDLSIIVSPVLDATDTTRPWLTQEIRDLRVLQAATVSELSTTQSPIHLADTEKGWTVAGDTYDNCTRTRPARR